MATETITQAQIAVLEEIISSINIMISEYKSYAEDNDDESYADGYLNGLDDALTLINDQVREFRT